MKTDNSKYLYRFVLGSEVLAETYGAYNARKIFNSLAPPLKLSVRIQTYMKLEESQTGEAGNAITSIIQRIESLRSSKVEQE